MMRLLVYGETPYTSFNHWLRIDTLSFLSMVRIADSPVGVTNRK